MIDKLKLYGFDKNAIIWIKSYLKDRKQIVNVSNQESKAKEINIGTPQGSRLSPLLFIILMADMDLWTKESMLSNFADDTQSIIIRDCKEKAIETTVCEANSVMDFFNTNNLVNNPEKAAVLHNSNGKGTEIFVENIVKQNIKSSYSEKLLGLYINFDFGWSTHIEKLSIELKQRIGLLKRIKQRVPRNKLIMIAEGIFNSKIRYGIAVYLTPIFEKEDLKVKKIPKNTHTLQLLQNHMIRSVFGFGKKQHVNMEQVRNMFKIISINQMSVYHTLIEAHNLLWNSSSEKIKMKWNNESEKKYTLRSRDENFLKVPNKPISKCAGFSYYAPNLFN